MRLLFSHLKKTLFFLITRLNFHLVYLVGDEVDAVSVDSMDLDGGIKLPRYSNLSVLITLITGH